MKLSNVTTKLKVTDTTNTYKRVPLGIYPAEIVKVEVGEVLFKNVLQNSVKIDFVLHHPEYEGSIFPLFASYKLSKSNEDQFTSKLYRVVKCLLNQELTTDQEIDLQDLVGKRCQVQIADSTNKKWQNVVNVHPF